MKNNKLILTFMVIFTLLLLAACGQDDSTTEKTTTPSEEVVWEENLLNPDEPTKVTFYSYSLGNASMKDGVEKLINNFNETIGAEKGIVVEGVVDADYTKSRTDIQSGLQVDIIQQTFPGLDGARNDLGVVAFEDAFPQEELDAHFEGIPDTALQLGVIQDKMYGMAFTFSTPILYVNGDIFEQAGLDPTVAPKSWEEMFKMAKQIKEKTGIYGLALSPSNSTGWVSDSILYSGGSEILNEDKTAVVFDNKNAISTLETWKQFYAENVAIGGTDTDAVQAFLSGNAAMHLQSTSLYSGFKSTAASAGWDLYGYAMPGFKGEESIPTNSGSAIAVRPDSEQKAQAIWEFVKYITGDEGYTTITKDIGYLPLRPYLAEDENYLKDFVDENPIIKLNIERLSNIKPATIWPGETANEVQQLYLDMFDKALTTDRDVAEVVKETQEEINSLLE
ncbi:ABC transporter substrate-binding protein [Metabacillus rhizolycopersici]|uniref:ABC transporter substrate-binding protein n=1 Tax=Metabacillus rhizolycopersici TaxID=2875709 RepID=A0ABS7V093_9BACI|nr:ABC transporter substrate-binding protein [Metabacillus rhizolycopersici]MBZ5753594.1 ABC transporter substrate-binding protein [Metabacillus rhizolycopersici]